jgi:adiponectin receptor
MRIVLYVAMAAHPVFMYFHIVYQFGFYHESSHLWGFLGLTYLCYLAGLIVYAWRIPERFWPGKFDIFVRYKTYCHLIAF